jgi:quercetin dioxygenase-like cupin family protein
MITEQQQERASLYALGALTPAEERAFEKELLGNPELHTFTRGLQRTSNLIVGSVPMAELPADLKGKVLRRIEQAEGEKSSAKIPASALAGLRFLDAAAESGWKQLPVPGAFIKLLSLEKERGYAVLLGKIEAGVRYPAHVNAGPENFYILSGDLVVGDRKLRAGDFHHADSGSKHEVNYSVEGCTLLAVLTTDDPLVAFAMA